MADDTVSMDELERTERGRKLHPIENDESTLDDDGKPLSLTELRALAYEDEEQLTEFDRFRLAVGDDPDNPINVYDVNGAYEVIDGDRRLRALELNGVEDGIPVNVIEEDLSEAERRARSIRTNEQRKQNDKEALSRNTAQYVAPWLLPPNARIREIEEGNIRDMDQTDWARECGVTQSTVSQRWLKPVREEYPIRDAIVDLKQSWAPSAEEVELLDEAIEYLRDGGEDGSRVVLSGQEDRVADGIRDLEEVSIREIRNAAKKAAEEGMTEQEFLDYIDDVYGVDEADEFSTDDLDMVDETSTEPQDVSGSAPSTTTKTGTTAQTVESSTDETVESSADDETAPIAIEEPNIDWSEYISDDDLPPAATVAQFERQKMLAGRFEGESAVALNLLSTLYDMTTEELIEEFVGPLVTKEAASILQDQYAE